MKVKTQFNKRCCEYKFIITIDDGEYPIEEASEILNIPLSSLLYACKIKNHGRPFDKWVREALWKVSKNVSIKQRVITVDGQRMCTEVLMNMTGLKKTTANLKMRKWESGVFTYQEMVETAEEGRLRRDKKAAERVQHNNKIVIQGMQPRRTVHDLIPLSQWEKDNPPIGGY